MGLVSVAIILQAFSNPYDGTIYMRVLTDLEFWATIFALVGLILAERASSVDSDKEITEVNDVKKKKDALIINEVAITLNFACCLLYFVFMPIVYGS
jgi:hypothetical protein